MAEKNLEFGKRLEGYILEAGLNKKRLADTIGVSPSAVGTYINEGRIPEAPILLKIAQSLNKSMEELLTGKNFQHYKEKRGMNVSVPLNLDLIKGVIEAIEEVFQKERLLLPPKKKAELITLIYEEILEDESKRDKIETRVLRLVKLAV